MSVNTKKEVTKKAIGFLGAILLASSLLVLSGCGASAPEPFNLQNGEAVISNVDLDPGYSVFNNATGSASTSEVTIAVWVEVKVPNGEELTDFSGAANELEALSYLETTKGVQIGGDCKATNSVSGDGDKVWHFQMVFIIDKDIDPYALISCADDTRSQLAYFRE
jgi:hypothetical protein